jgi:hypothetical protein
MLPHKTDRSRPEWTSAFANLTAESLAEAMTFKEFVEVNRAGAVSLSCA